MKALRQAKKRTIQHRLVTRDLKTAIKKARKTTETKTAEAQKLLSETVRLIDKSVRKKVMKKNTAARAKSRLMKLWNKRATAAK